MTPLEKAVDELYNLVAMKLDKEEMMAFEYRLTEFRDASLKEAMDYFKECISQTIIGGIQMPIKMLNKLDVVHPDHTSPHSRYANQMHRVRGRILRAEYQNLCKKEEFAVSGAMRWEFSQEAPTWLDANYKSTDTEGTL